MPAAHIVDLADFVTLCDGDQGVDHVGNEGEVAGLLAIADDGQRLVGQELGEKNAEHRAIGSAGPRARSIDVEKAHRNGRQTIDLGPMHDQLLAEIFGQRVGIARIGRRGFGRRIARGNAVAGGGSDVDQPLYGMAARGLKHAKRTVDIGAEIGLGFLDRGHDVGARGEVKHPLGSAVAVAITAARSATSASTIAQKRISVVLLEVSAPADNQIVEHADRTALGQQAIHEVTADKAGAARHQINSYRRCQVLAPSKSARYEAFMRA